MLKKANFALAKTSNRNRERPGIMPAIRHEWTKTVKRHNPAATLKLVAMWQTPSRNDSRP